MKAWRLEKLGGRLALDDVPVPEPRPGSVLVRVEASALLSYLKAYVEGKLPRYNPPPGPFTIGTNAVGTVEAVGRDVWRIAPGRRVVLSPHFVARENVDDPAQILIGLTAGAEAADVLADWPDGTHAEYALAPVETATPLDGLEGVDAAQLAVLGRFIVPFGGLLRGRLAAGETLVVNGATGAFGTAAVLLGVAMGAARVIAAGRNRDALAAVADAAGPRVAQLALTGDVAADAKAIRVASGGGGRHRLRHGRKRHRSALDAGGADQSQAQRPARADGQHDRRPAAAVHAGHAQQLGDHRPVHVSAERLSAVARTRPQRPSRLERDQAEGFSADGAARGDGGGGRRGEHGSRRDQAMSVFSSRPRDGRSFSSRRAISTAPVADERAERTTRRRWPYIWPPAVGRPDPAAARRDDRRRYNRGLRVLFGPSIAI